MKRPEQNRSRLIKVMSPQTSDSPSGQVRWCIVRNDAEAANKRTGRPRIRYRGAMPPMTMVVAFIRAHAATGIRAAITITAADRSAAVVCRMAKLVAGTKRLRAQERIERYWTVLTAVCAWPERYARCSTRVMTTSGPPRSIDAHHILHSLLHWTHQRVMH
jgi:hypothetical protein